MTKEEELKEILASIEMWQRTKNDQYQIREQLEKELGIVYEQMVKLLIKKALLQAEIDAETEGSPFDK